MGISPCRDSCLINRMGRARACQAVVDLDINHINHVLVIFCLTLSNFLPSGRAVNCATVVQSWSSLELTPVGASGKTHYKHKTKVIGDHRAWCDGDMPGTFPVRRCGPGMSRNSRSLGESQMKPRVMKALSLLLALALAGCAPEAPIRIGLLAGLSDRGSDFGESVRNGVILAIEQQNQAGGIHGRMIELIVRDDGQDAEQAVKAAQELIALKPELVIGPVTSSMATVVLPVLDAAGMLTISPTVASPAFYGKDDHFFRVNRTTHEAARHHAKVLFDRQARRVALAFDASNAPYSDTWVSEFTRTFEQLGGKVSATSGFDSTASPSFGDVLKPLLARQPDALLFVASSLDTARLCQQARRLAPELPLSSTEWAASGELLTEMGGSAVDGLLIAHAYNRDDQGAPYLAFRSAFKARFQREFGSFSLLAYDTANVVIEAMIRRNDSESMKSALLKYGPYAGVQQSIRFDANGDAERQVFFTEIRGGRFIQIP